MIGALISAGSAIGGSLISANSAKNAQEQNARLQKEFAQNGIQWKVADALKAGVHPLYALGAQTTAYAPSAVGDTSFGSGIAQAGQDIGRAIDATRSPSQRLDAVGKTMQDLQLQRMGLENQLLASQIAKVNQAGSPPPLPSATQRFGIDGQGPTAIYQPQPHQPVAGNPGHPNMEPGAVTDMGFTTTGTGQMPVMSKDAKERLEEDIIGGILWNVRNRVMPSIGANYNPPPATPKPGHVWIYNPIYQEYQQVPKDHWSKRLW